MLKYKNHQSVYFHRNAKMFPVSKYLEIPKHEQYWTQHLRQKDGTTTTVYIPEKDIKSVIQTEGKALYIHLLDGYFGPFKNVTWVQADFDKMGIKTFLPTNLFDDKK